MAKVYNIVTNGTPPITLSEAKAFMKVTRASEDTLIKTFIDAATQYGQRYTGREFCANTWRLKLDCFETKIEILRSPIATLDSFTYKVAGVATAVPSANYYLKQGQTRSWIVLASGESWPTNGDEIEQGIVATFTTSAYAEGINQIKLALLRCVTYMYKNRGDCDDVGVAALMSGAAEVYNTLIVPRV